MKQKDFLIQIIYFSLLTNIWNYVVLDESLALQDRLLEKAIVKIQKTTQQSLDNKLFWKCYTFTPIFIANNVQNCINMFICFFILPLRKTANHVFCYTLLGFGMGRPRTPPSSNIETFLTIVNSCNSFKKSFIFLYI